MSRVNITTIAALQDYNHLGDPVCVKDAGTWFLFVPITGEPGVPAGVAVFDAPTLQFIDLETLQGEKGEDDPDVGDGWRGADPQGDLYLSYAPEDTERLAKYRVGYDSLHALGVLSLDFQGVTSLFDFGGSPLTFSVPQGGAFSPSGDLLSMVTGFFDDTEQEQVENGIHVFDTSTWRRIRHSTNGYGLFNYAYDPDGLIDEEPEGLTFWDLDGGQAPGISGQLQVLLLDNDGPGASDEIYLKHYSGAGYVDGLNSGIENGSRIFPFNTVGEASALAWDGVCIRIAGNTYPETLTLSERMTVTTTGGTVTIGP